MIISSLGLEAHLLLLFMQKMQLSGGMWLTWGIILLQTQVGSWKFRVCMKNYLGMRQNVVLTMQLVFVSSIRVSSALVETNLAEFIGE